MLVHTLSKIFLDDKSSAITTEITVYKNKGKASKSFNDTITSVSLKLKSQGIPHVLDTGEIEDNGRAGRRVFFYTEDGQFILSLSITESKLN